MTNFSLQGSELFASYGEEFWDATAPASSGSIFVWEAVADTVGEDSGSESSSPSEGDCYDPNDLEGGEGTSRTQTHTYTQTHTHIRHTHTQHTCTHTHTYSTHTQDCPRRKRRSS